MFRNSLSFRAGLVAAIACSLTLGSIVSIGFYADGDAKTTRCKGRIVSLSISNTCPENTFLELVSDKGDRWIVCHCQAPVFTIEKPLDQEPDDEPPAKTLNFTGNRR